MTMMKVIEPDGTPGVRRVDYHEQRAGQKWPSPVLNDGEEVVWKDGESVPYIVRQGDQPKEEGDDCDDGDRHYWSRG